MLPNLSAVLKSLGSLTRSGGLIYLVQYINLKDYKSKEIIKQSNIIQNSGVFRYRYELVADLKNEKYNKNYENKYLAGQSLQILQQYQKMTILDYFKTTSKGIYLMKDLPPTTTLSRTFFVMSLALQLIILLYFVAIFGFSIFRSIKKIKNPKFKTDKDQQQEEQLENMQDQTNAKQTNDNLIYRFDQEDHQKEKKMEVDQQDKKDQEMDQNSEDQYDKDHDENEDKFLELDNLLLFLQPFLIGHIVCNCIFTTGVISLILIVATFVLFFVFNIKGVCSNNKWFQVLFIIPALGSFVPIFIFDHDMST